MGLYKRSVLVAVVAIIAYTVYEFRQIEIPKEMENPNVVRAVHFVFQKIIVRTDKWFGLGTGNRYSFALFNWLALKTSGEVEGVSTRDDEYENIPVRIYEPDTEANNKKRRVLVYFHGGGWVYGDRSGAAYQMLTVAKETKTVVISVEYRLATESPFPAAYDDCLSVVKYIIKNSAKLRIDATRIAVTGDSAGGNLAAVVANKMKKSIKLQLLVYPVLQGFSTTNPSQLQNQNGPVVTRKGLVRFTLIYGGIINKYDSPIVDMVLREQHRRRSLRENPSNTLAQYTDMRKQFGKLPKEWQSHVKMDDQLLKEEAKIMDSDANDAKKELLDDQTYEQIMKFLSDPRFSSLAASDDQLKGVPKSFIVTAGYDILRDEALLYAHRLKSLGNKVTLAHYSRAFHGFFSLDPTLNDTKQVLDEFVEFIDKNL